MRNLLWTLAWHECFAATCYLARRQYDRADSFIAQAGAYLEERARSRDCSERWQPVLGVIPDKAAA